MFDVFMRKVVRLLRIIKRWWYLNMAFRVNCVNKVLERGKHYCTCDWGYYSDGVTWHKGIDLIGDVTKSDTSIDNVCAFADGIVFAVCNSFTGQTTKTDISGCGNYVFIKHTNGWITRYMHLQKGSVRVIKGDSVKKGEVIGRMGMTGNATGYHLHFDISNDKYLPYGRLINDRWYCDPKPFLAGNRGFADIGYQKGTYVVTKDVNVRTAPSPKGARVYYYGMTENAKKQIKKISGEKLDYFPKGMRLTISEVSGTWGKCPSGWVSLNFCDPVK